MARDTVLHLGHERLPLKLEPGERAGLRVAAQLAGDRFRFLQRNSSNRMLLDFYRSQERDAERLTALLEEGEATEITADDVRVLRGFVARLDDGSAAGKAMAIEAMLAVIRLWDQPGMVVP